MNSPKKIVHKLDKASRMQIAANYINDKYKNELKCIEIEADRLAENIIKKAHDNVIPKDLLDSLCDDMDSFSISNIFYTDKSYKNSHNNCHVVTNINNNSYTGREGFPFVIYKKNRIKFLIKNDYELLQSFDLSDNKVCYGFIFKKNATSDLYKLKNDFLTLRDEIFKSFYECYDLIKKIRTAELLIKHWPDSEKYIPNNLKKLENNDKSIEDKFKLL